MTDNDSSSNLPPEHPGALNTGQRMLAMVKHVAGKALKWGAVAAIGGAVLFGFLPTFAAALTAGHLFTGLAGGAATTGALFLGAGGAIAGGLVGLSGMGEAADAAEEQSMFNFNRRQTHQTQAMAVQQNYQQQKLAMAQQAQNLGISPNISFGQGQESQQQEL